VRVSQFPGEATTNPKREAFGVTFALRGGDVLHPLGQGDWFKSPYFSRILRFWCPIPILPWITWNLFGWRGYLGAKIYGADSEAYANWMPATDVYVGSQALQFSARLRISD
jgi:hypothetical protein